jgi:phage protein D
MEISVDEELDEGVSFSLTMHDEFDMIKQKFKWLDDRRFFDVGNGITIKMGYGSSLSTMLMGNITSIEPSFFAGETPTLTIRGQDLSYDYMKRTSPERTFIDKSYSDIAQILASEAGLLAVVDNTPKFEPLPRKDSDESYYAFLMKLSKDIHFQFKMEGQTMYFVKPTDDKKEILTLELGKDIISFRPTLKTVGLVTEVEVRGHNPRDPSHPFEGKATSGRESTKESGKKTASQIAEERHGPIRKFIVNRIVNSEAHANSIAQAELNRISDTLIEGEVECIGIPQIRTGVNIRLEKMGDRFSDKYYVKKTTHRIDNSGYRTHFSVKSNSVKKGAV